MKKSQLYTIIVLSFASAAVDFLTLQRAQMVFPRDRIIHTAISGLLALTVAYILKYIRFEYKIVKTAAAIIVLSRLVYIWYRFTSFYHVFHGSQTVAISLLTVVMVVYFIRSKEKITGNIYSFFVVVNLSAFVLMLLLCFDKLNVINIYSNNLRFQFSAQKIFMYFDVFTIAVLCKNSAQRIYVQKRYIGFITLYIVAITLLQGLCINGNIMYSISPLQSLVQIFSSDTIRRFDYIITIYQTFNYFGAVMLNIWALQSLLTKAERAKDEV